VDPLGCGTARRRVIRPGDATALAAAIRMLAGDRQRARKMGLDGKSYLERNFSRDQIARRLLDVLESTLLDGSTNDRSH
jgi:glycosyltransferase involved in cell wall biosynthesis